MNKYLLPLTAVLLIQLSITALLFADSSAVDSDLTAKTLINIDQETLNEISIKAASDEIVLTKSKQGWQLKAHPTLPIMKHKVQAITQELANINLSWPVASTSNSHERFKVAESDFEKQITFKNSAGETQTLLLGNSPSYKNLYARNADNNEVYNIKFSSYQLTPSLNNWLDKSLLSVADIAKISHADVSLNKADEQWQLAAPSTLSDGQALDQNSIETLVNHLQGLTVTSMSEVTPKSSEQLTVTNAEGQQYTYAFATEQDSYLVSRNDFDYWFTLPKAKFEQLANLSLDKITSSIEVSEDVKDHKTSE